MLLLLLCRLDREAQRQEPPTPMQPPPPSPMPPPPAKLAPPPPPAAKLAPPPPAATGPPPPSPMPPPPAKLAPPPPPAAKLAPPPPAATSPPRLPNQVPPSSSAVKAPPPPSSSASTKSPTSTVVSKEVPSRSITYPTLVVVCRTKYDSVSSPSAVSSWELAKVVKRFSAEQLTVAALSDEEEWNVENRFAVAFEFSGSLSTLGDLALLPSGDNIAVMFAIFQRFRMSFPYTFAGPMLIAINPYQWLSYAKSTPHPRIVAERALAGLLQESSQSSSTVLITGISGAGKTESAKIVVDVLREGCQMSNEDISRALQAMNPVLELFGNAPTAMNDNSSRFAKLLSFELVKDSTAPKSPSMVSVSIETYLLEVSRLVTRNDREGTFHVFSLMFGPGFPLEWKEQFDLWDPTQFQALKNSKGGYVTASSPPYTMAALMTALKTCGLNETHMESIFRALAGVLHLLNVEFAAEDQYAPASVSNQNALLKAAKCLGLELPPAASTASTGTPTSAVPSSTGTVFLEQILTTVRLGGDVKQLHKAAAMATRDSLARSVYEGIFQLLVSKLCSTRHASPASATPSSPKERQTFKVLDIFGFETVTPPAVNDLEQLLINFTNELLQSIYDETTFTAFKAEVDREGLHAAMSELEDQEELLHAAPVSKCLDILTRRPNGVLNVISDDSTLAQQSAQQAVQLAEKILALQRVFPDVVKRNKINQTVFQLSHYCDTVEYSTENLAKRNRISSGVAYVLRGSSNQILREAHTYTFANQKSATSQITLFREQLEVLSQELRKSQLFWIRCIKPNHNKSPYTFDGEFVAAQLGASGVYRTTKLLAEGYSVRVSHQTFASQYLLPFFSGNRTTKPAAEQFFSHFSQGRYREAVSWATKTAPPCQNKKILLGTSLVFAKAATAAELRDLSAVWTSSMTLRIQKAARGYCGRRSVAKLSAAKIKAANIAKAQERIQHELPIRQALEEQRMQLHQHQVRKCALATAGVHQLAQKMVTKVFRQLQHVTATVNEEIARGLQDIALHDDRRLSKEAEEKERVQRLLHSEQAAMEILRKEHALQKERQAQRERVLELQRARAAERDRRVLVTQEEADRIRSNMASAKKLQLEAEAAARARQLARSQEAYERSIVAEARKHIALQTQRTQSPGVGVRFLARPHYPAAGASPSTRSNRTATNEYRDASDFVVQKDLWRLWERSCDT